MCDTDSKAGLSVVSWYLLVVQDREVDPCPFCLVMTIIYHSLDM